MSKLLFFFIFSLIFSVPASCMQSLEDVKLRISKIKEVELPEKTASGKDIPYRQALIKSDELSYISLRTQNTPKQFSIFTLFANGEYTRKEEHHHEDGRTSFKLAPLTPQEKNLATFHIRIFFKKHGFKLCTIPKKGKLYDTHQ